MSQPLQAVPCDGDGDGDGGGDGGTGALEWHEQALCAQIDAEWFFPGEGTLR